MFNTRIKPPKIHNPVVNHFDVIHMIIDKLANDMLLVHHFFINSLAAFQMTFCYFLALGVKKWLYFVSMPFLTYRFYDMRRGQRIFIRKGWHLQL